MPPPSNRMTKNRQQPTRYRPGKAEVDDADSDKETGSSDSDAGRTTAKAPPPKASSFPSQKKLAVDLSKAGQQTSAAPQVQPKKPDEDLDGFITASESSEEEANDSDEEGDDDGSEDEESSEEDEPERLMLRPTFIPKAKRTQQISGLHMASAGELALESERQRLAKADELLQAQLQRDEAARAAGRRAWDDDADLAPEDEVDDTDDLDHEAEHAAWKLRELKRVRRDRLVIEEKEKGLEEVERRRNMSAEERAAEDKIYIDAQNEEREGRGKMAFMQKYHHKGAFFQADDEDQDEEVKAAMRRNLDGVRFADETGDKAVLPEYMRIRDMTKLGKKGRTKYKDLKSEDTGQWGQVGARRRQDGDVDERFRADGDGGGERERTGANDAPLGERRRREDDGDGARDGKRPRYD